MESVELIPFHSCWEWIGNKNWGGYGLVRANGLQHGAHRVSYELHKGEIPDSFVILHGCDNPGCVRPDHLMAGSQSANMRDMIHKGRGRNKYGPMRAAHKPIDPSLFLPILKHNEIKSVPLRPKRGHGTLG